MAQIPKFQETFIPILKVLADGKLISVNDLRNKVRTDFYSDLPVELLEQKTKNGQPLILNRIHWGKVYLKQADMVHQPERGMIQITGKGYEILKKGSLTGKELLNDKDFLAKQKATKEEKESDFIGNGNSPQDLIDSGFRAIEEQVKHDLLVKIKKMNPYSFETVVLILLEKMGYGEMTKTPKSGDGGIDGIINQDKLGLDKIFIQVKRYTDNKVREVEMRSFIGAMNDDAHKGIFVTTSSFDTHALQKARDARQKIITIDGTSLVELMLKYGVGVQVQNTYEVKEIDEDFFDEE